MVGLHDWHDKEEERGNHTQLEEITEIVIKSERLAVFFLTLEDSKIVEICAACLAFHSCGIVDLQLHSDCIIARASVTTWM